MAQLYFSRKGDEVFLLKSALTQAGFWIGQAPAMSLHSADLASLETHLNKMLSQPTAEVPTPARDSFPTPAALQIPYKKSWRSFQKDFETVSIARDRVDSYSITAYLPNGLPDETRASEYSGPDAFVAVVNDIASRIGTLSHSH